MKIVKLGSSSGFKLVFSTFSRHRRSLPSNAQSADLEIINSYIKYIFLASFDIVNHLDPLGRLWTLKKAHTDFETPTEGLKTNVNEWAKNFHPQIKS